MKTDETDNLHMNRNGGEIRRRRQASTLRAEPLPLLLLLLIFNEDEADGTGKVRKMKQMGWAKRGGTKRS
ncbi:hypothetical protein D8674_009081 [Pyrus ussuriensis x Pyrus communis]|uniref:Uncharacterized protein n=1 Tax=Pyrus ussuriensis x Pyrus communis TaxID=2448454 RepID=A0A5N5HZL4_9ROSA|nr:hypothetical protein D8674_009081 [Pyrus ussuriensis x Pyrus communis]